MDEQEILREVKTRVSTHLPGAKVILFGSRAKGSQDKLSDYDLLIVTKEKLTPREKIHWGSIINKDIVKNILIPVDVIVDNEDEVNIKKMLPGHIFRSVVNDGVTL